jgi:hypothetical protein
MNAGGKGGPPVPAGIHLGERISKLFTGVLGGRGLGNGHGTAPALPAEYQLPPATRKSGVYEARVGAAVMPTKTYGGEDVNGSYYGRINQHLPIDLPLMPSILPGKAITGGLNINPMEQSRYRNVGKRFKLYGQHDDDELDGAWLEPGMPITHAGGISAGPDQNDAAGGLLRKSQLRIRDEGETVYGIKMHGGGGPVLLHDMSSGKRTPKSDGARTDFATIGGMKSHWIGAGEQVAYKPRTLFTPVVGAKGGAKSGKTAPDSIFTLHGNMLYGTRGANVGSEPLDISSIARKNKIYGGFARRGTADELDDLMSVEHS